MKLFFASDIHGSLSATEFMLEKYRLSGANHLILLGDILNHGPRNPIPDSYAPADVAQCLNEFSRNIIAVRGNCDSEVDQMLLTFPMLEAHSWILLENGTRLFLTHGHIYNDQNRPPLSKGDVVAYGHTHIPVAQKHDEVTIFNPGSVTLPKGGHLPSYGLFEDGCLKVMGFSGEVFTKVTL
jgi:putative phosphoesterase